MKVHEYQAKEIFRQFGIPVPRGKACFSPEEAVVAARELGTPICVVKAQIHAGGRGKGGGVKLAKSLDETRNLAKQMLGMTLVTVQTGPEGKEVKRLLVEEGADIGTEAYLAITLDRSKARLVIMASPAGGMDIEEVAEHTPDKIFREWIDPTLGLREFQTRRLAKLMGYKGPAAKEFSGIVKKLLDLYVKKDCTLVEINPLVTLKNGSLIALDAKMDFDENGMFRHPELIELRDENEEDPQETAAKKFDLSFIALDGDIGCMVNGAGLAMATMDIIKLEGGAPANFLDVGGGATAEKVKEAFKIILSDKKVKAILVNIFGGIMKCDVIATGVIAAAKELSVKVPLVVRLEGTNVDLGKKMLAESGLAITPATGMKDAAQKVVQAAKGKQ